jgi:hypothetical protein
LNCSPNILIRVPSAAKGFRYAPSVSISSGRMSRDREKRDGGKGRQRGQRRKSNERP